MVGTHCFSTLLIDLWDRMKPHQSYFTYLFDKYMEIIWLTAGRNYTDTTKQFVSQCCTLHGCRLRDDRYCQANKQELGKLFAKKQKIDNPLILYHYSRSLEKYGLKSKTWETASGNDPTGYNVIHFMERNLGRQADRSALQYACQLRKGLADMTSKCL